MSTKTNFKRIALVAVAALGLGVISSVPSNAAVSSLTTTVVNGTSSFTRSDTTTAATLNLAGLMEANDCITIVLVTKSVPSGTVPAVFITNLDSTTSTISGYVIDTYAASAAGNLVRQGTNGTLPRLETTVAATQVRISKNTGAASINQKFGIQLDSATARVAGTYTYTALIKTYNAGSTLNNSPTAQPDSTVAVDISVVVAAAASTSTVPVAANSFVDILASAQASGSDANDAIINGVATAGTVAGYIYVGNRNAENAVSVAEDSLTATVVGAGQVCSAALAASPTAITCGKSIKVSAIGDYQFILQGDGSSGTSQITVTSSVAGYNVSKNASFYLAAPKTITATVGHPIFRVGT
ncbi:MAG: hypothetical protein EBS18_06345, partial [Actinobacteria bacterium]|nr:hypothetical protein [Actinomycetota bacterium]